MNSYEIYIAIAVMAVVNFFTRVFPFLFFRKIDLPPYIIFIEKYFPSVIMTILIVYTLKDINFDMLPYGIKEWDFIYCYITFKIEKLFDFNFCRYYFLYGISSIFII